MADRLSVAVIGCRGIPATYGGIERHVEEICVRIAAEGAHVVVFCRAGYASQTSGSLAGIERRFSRGRNSKHLEALTHTAWACVSALRQDYDVVHVHGVGPGAVAILLWPKYHNRLVLTVHAFDFSRAKWGPAAQRIFRSAARVALSLPAHIIVVSSSLRAALRRRYGVEATYVPNGIPTVRRSAPSLITKQYGLAGGDYLLSVGRLVPEKGHALLIESFLALQSPTLRLVIAGGSSHSDEYVDKLYRRGVRAGVLFTGYVYGAVLEELYSNALLYVQPSYLEGMPLTVLEAMAYKLPVVLSDIPEHSEIIGRDVPGARLASVGDRDALARVLASALLDIDTEREGALERADAMAKQYSWDRAARETLAIYQQLRARR